MGKGFGKKEMMQNGIRGTMAVWPVIFDLLGDAKLILDVGCGEHVWSYKGAVIKRCDNNQDYRDRSGPLVGCRNVDLNGKWPYSDDRFDTVVAADVIEHLENPWHFFREATRVATKSVIVSTPNVESVMSKKMFSRTGFLWGFNRSERENSHHIMPIFLWQVKKAIKDVGWDVGVIKKVSLPVPKRRAARLSIADVACQKGNERWLLAMAVPRSR